MDAVNPTLEAVDVCIVIGANDVVNPSALEDEQVNCRMPIIEVMKAKTVLFLKRSMNLVFWYENPLFFNENTRCYLVMQRKVFKV